MARRIRSFRTLDETPDVGDAVKEDPLVQEDLSEGAVPLTARLRDRRTQASIFVPIIVLLLFLVALPGFEMETLVDYVLSADPFWLLAAFVVSTIGFSLFLCTTQFLFSQGVIMPVYSVVTVILALVTLTVWLTESGAGAVPMLFLVFALHASVALFLGWLAAGLAARARCRSGEKGEYSGRATAPPQSLPLAGICDVWGRCPT